MSNIYVLEPPTSGKVLMKTTVGDIDIELWTKEAPKTCRNFIQLCLEDYYNNLIFHRVIPEFIVQGGDPKGDGTGGESIYGEPFKDEFHQRLRFSRRGLLAMANAGKDDNGSQFFFTLGATPELQNKHTIFGKVTGDTIFNMLKLQEGLIEDERPVYPHKVLKTEVLNNPFSDIEPRIKKVASEKKQVKKLKKAGVKNFKLLSFGDEAEEDEEESKRENEKLVAKGKSSHDVLDDPKLSSETEIMNNKPDNDESDHEQQLENIRKKLKSSSKKAIPVKLAGDDEEESAFGVDNEEIKKRKVEELRKEMKNLKKEYQSNKLRVQNEEKEKIGKNKEKESTLQQYNDENDKYKDIKKSLLKKGSEREQFTLNLLEKFKKKLRDAKEQEAEEEEEALKEKEKEESQEDKQWMNHEFHFEDNTPVLAKDANTKDDDWFEIYDPRNPLNKRRRGETTTKTNK